MTGGAKRTNHSGPRAPHCARRRHDEPSRFVQFSSAPRRAPAARGAAPRKTSVIRGSRPVRPSGARRARRCYSFSCIELARRRSRRLRKSTASSSWSWLKQVKTTRSSPVSRVPQLLEALRADLLHHALHRRVDAPDGDVARVEQRREHAVACLAHRVHHAVAADGDDARDLLERDRRRPAQRAGAVCLHRLHDVAAEVPVLRAARLDGRPDVGAPDDLVGASARCRRA